MRYYVSLTPIICFALYYEGPKKVLKAKMEWKLWGEILNLTDFAILKWIFNLSTKEELVYNDVVSGL